MSVVRWGQGAFVLMAAVAALGMPARPALADDAAPEASKLSVHGFLTQAYGRAANDHHIFGIDDKGTTDYRTAALQFGYSLTDKDRLVIQLAHERSGDDSFFVSFVPDVDLDWAFYEHKFSDNTRLRVGRVMLPVGIYNEIRDVGTLLPFYRPPQGLYAEVNFATETIDGLVGQHIFHAGKWSLEVNPFFGGWDSIGRTQQGPFETSAYNAVGASAWIQTPIEGVRVGGAAFRSSTRLPEADEDDKTWRLMADASFEKVVVRGEYFRNSDEDSNWYGFYVLGTVRPTDKLALNLQYTKVDIDFVGGRAAGNTYVTARDLAGSINYSYRPNIVLKLEAHNAKNSNVFSDEPAPDADYGIASVSVSF